MLIFSDFTVKPFEMNLLILFIAGFKDELK